MTVVVDDSHSVWAQHRRNLVVVERYVYFPSSRQQLGLRTPSLWEANRCVRQGGEPMHGASGQLAAERLEKCSACVAPPALTRGTLCDG